ncbi:MAG: hypothetical protein PUB12_10580 [[Clostridium] aminophilum]|nr:hypothetical protein [[Clostridium] aminophilum]MDD6197309.1 hypothetical protein [[Clostridium] aminophilum]
MILDAPDNKGPIAITLTDSTHMTMSGINVLRKDKVISSGISWNRVRGS